MIGTSIPGCPLSPAVLRRRTPSSSPGPGDGSDAKPALGTGDMGSKTKLTDKVMQNAMTTALQDDLPFVLFSPESLVKYEEQRNKVLQEYGFLPKRQPSILDGSILPKRFEPVPPYFFNKPIEELETGIYEKTFCVLSLRFHKIYVNRLTATNSLFLFSPWNPIRKACVALVTNQYFDYLMILTILVNCVFLALSNPIEQAEYVFLSIYTTEMLIKSIAKGFVLNKYTYLRIPWNWLDFVVIILGFVTIFVDLGKLSGLRTFRVFRALKTVSILPGLKTIVNALLHSLKMLSEVMLLTVFCLMVFALFALQIYMGSLRNKCVRTPIIPMSHEAYLNYTITEANWLKEDEEDENDAIVCGNSSGAMPCPKNYTCLPDIGDNPNFGYTSFDNFGSAMLTTFQLITLDFWENVYDKIIGSNGPFSVIFFILVVFFGSFYLVNLMLAVVAMSYEEEVEATQSELNKDRNQFEDAETQNTPTKKPKKKRIITRRGAITVSDPVSDTENELPEPPPPLTNPLPPRTAAGRDLSREPAILKILPVNSRIVQDTGVPGVPYSRYNKNSINEKNASKLTPKNNSFNSKDSVKKTNAPNNNTPKPLRKAPNTTRSISRNQTRPTQNKPSNKNITNYGVTRMSEASNRPPTRQVATAPASFIMCECGLEVCEPSKASCTFAAGIPCVNDAKQTNTTSRPASRIGMTLHPFNHMVSRDSATSTGTNTYDRALSELYKSTPEEEEKPVDIKVIDDTLPDRNCKCCSHCCSKYTWWLKFQKLVYNIVYDPLVELFITACIIANTVFLAIEHHGMSPSLKEVLSIGNKVFTAIFTIETVLKLICLSKEYFKNTWNVFDLTIVFFSLMEMGLENISGLSVLRALRLLRVFKLAQSWTTMRVLLSIIVSTLGALGNLTLVLVIIMYIFAVLGMQLFGNNYRAEKFPDNEVPRWNFQDFVHSFMMIFRVLCGEWIEPMWDCMKASGESCMAIFIPALVVGNFMVLNLFLALLLSSFNSEELSKNNKKDEDVSRLMLGIKRLKYVFCCCCRVFSSRLKKERRSSVETILSEKDENITSFANSVYEDNEDPPAYTIPTTPLNNHIKPSPIDALKGRPAAGSDNTPPDRKITWSPVVDYVDNLRRGSLESLEITDTLLQLGTTHAGSQYVRADVATQTSELNLHSKTDVNGTVISQQPTIDKDPNEKPTLSRQTSEGDEHKSTINILQEAVAEEGQTVPLAERNPEDCFPHCFYKRCCCCKSVLTSKAAECWFQFRKKIILFVDHWIFEWGILILIFASSVTLCFEDKYLDDNKPLRETLYYLNILFCIIYGLEMILKWLAHGLVVYFSNGWSILDFIIVMASILSVVVDGNKNLVALRSVRTLRALRPLRAISRWQGMKIVVNALMSAIPSIFNVLLVCIVFWLIFSIMGVQFFAGRFYRCVNDKDELIDADEVNNRTECDALKHTKKYKWVNTEVNFDNVGQGYLALFQVATFEGWMEVMEYAVDARGVDLQPSKEANLSAYLYFIVFIVCGSFFTLNLFIGVIIDNFNMLKKKYEGGVVNMFLTESQKNYYAAMKKLGRKKPQKLIRRPINRCQALFYDLSMSRRFEMVVFIIIMANMVCMGIEHYKQSADTEKILELMNIVFTSLFVVEAVIKIIGLRHYYFTVLWNVFDFVLVVASILGIVMKDLLTSTNFFVSPTLLRVLRVFRIGRILRLIKAAKGIRKLLFALIVSLPALFNIGALIFLIMFIYAIIGMSLFARVRHNGAITPIVNFETFGRSIMLLFRLLTSAGWNDILDALMIQPPECNEHYLNLPNGDCGNSTFAIIYLVSYVIINFMIIINMYIAVILENFNQAHQEEELGIVEDDLEMFYVNWAKYDPYATQFISFWELDDFVDTLDPPLRIAKPNNIAIVSFNLPIAKGMKIHCLDILHALVKHELGHVEETEDFQKLRSQMEEKFKKQFPTRKHLELVTTTLQWKRYDFAARIVQKAFNRHRNKRLREQQGMAQEPATSARPSSKLGRGLRTLSQFLNLPRALPGSAIRRSARSRPITSRSQRSTKDDEDVDRIFYTQAKT